MSDIRIALGKRPSQRDPRSIPQRRTDQHAALAIDEQLERAVVKVMDVASRGTRYFPTSWKAAPRHSTTATRTGSNLTRSVRSNLLDDGIDRSYDTGAGTGDDKVVLTHGAYRHQSTMYVGPQGGAPSRESAYEDTTGMENELNPRDHIVFIVDDDRRICESLSALLSTYDLHVVTFGSATEYIAYPKPTCRLA